jgi:hypothetical protein
LTQLQSRSNQTGENNIELGRQFLKMRFTALLIGLLAYLVSSVTATALTYRLEANEKACFYKFVEQRNTKVAFYFAVRYKSPFY